MQTLYFVECDFGKSGRAFVETDPEKNSRANVIDDIVDGQVEDVLRVLQVIPEEGTCRDVTEDIARDVYARLDETGSGCPAHLRDWIDHWVEIGAADRLDIAAGLYDFAATRADHLIDLRKHEAA